MSGPSQASIRRGPHEQPAERDHASVDVVLRCFAATIGSDSGMLLGYDPRDRPQLLSACGMAATRSTVPWTSGSFLGQALKADSAALEAADVDPDANGAGAWSAVAAPILGLHGRLGAIYAGFTPPSTMDPERLGWIADSHARLAALCMEEQGGIAAALRASGIDHLTGCLSYERTLDVLRAEVERSRRRGHRLSCCFLDLDGFKAINERHGHVEGNRVLGIVGRALRNSARPYDGIGRFGGDEFVIVLPETGGPAARRAVERLRWRVTFTVAEETGMVLECSAGIAELSDVGSASGLLSGSVLALLQAADSALQLAKAEGGARTSGGLPEEGRFEGLLERTRTAIRGPGDAPGDAEGAGGA
jgi:diguanylate cyclase (GGDEF)-like protein